MSGSARRPDEVQRKAYREALALVRERGFAVGLPRQEVQQTFTDGLKGREESSEIQRGEFEKVVAGLQFDPAEMAADPDEETLIITAPIFNTTGNVVLSLTVQGFSPQQGGSSGECDAGC